MHTSSSEADDVPARHGGIGDLYKYFLRARRDSRTRNGAFALFNLLEETVIRRTRPFIRTAYPEATIRGKRIHFPERKLKTVRYNLEATYAGIYDEIVSGIDSLKLAPYNLEANKKAGVEVDEFEAGREQALVGIFKSSSPNWPAASSSRNNFGAFSKPTAGRCSIRFPTESTQDWPGKGRRAFSFTSKQMLLKGSCTFGNTTI